MMRAGGDVQPVARLHLEDVVADANPEESLDDRVALVLRVRVLLEDRALAVRVHDDLIALPLEKSHDALFRHGTVLLGPGLEARLHASASDQRGGAQATRTREATEEVR